MQVGQLTHRRLQPIDATTGFIHAEDGSCNRNFSGGFAPLLFERGFHANLLDGLNDARDAFEFAFGLQYILSRHIFADVFHFLLKFFFFAVENFLPARHAFDALFEVRAVVAAIGFCRAGKHF